MKVSMDAVFEQLSWIADQAIEGPLSNDQARLILETLYSLSERLEMANNEMLHQQEQMAHAIQLYKRYNAWTDPIEPEPGKVLEWLLDVHAGRKQALELREVISDIHARLQELGTVDFNAEYAVRGSYLIGLRIVVKNALTLFRIEEVLKPKKNASVPPVRFMSHPPPK